MTTELEKQFYKTFEIEPKIIDACKITDEYWNNEELADKYGYFTLYMREKCPYDEDCRDNCEYAFNKIEYPEITDRVLLELICLLSQYFYLFEDLHVKTVSELKDCVLQKCITTIIDDTDEIHQIQQLFKEEE